MTSERLIVGVGARDALAGLALAERLGDAAGCYRIGLDMLTGGGLALALELKAEHGKRILLDLKLFDEAATIEATVRDLAHYDLDFLTVHGDPHVVRAAAAGAAGSVTRILAVTLLPAMDRAELDAGLFAPGAVPEVIAARAARAFGAGADGVVVPPAQAARLRTLPGMRDRLIVTELGSAAPGPMLAEASRGADLVVVGRAIWSAASPRRAAEKIAAAIA